ncbi:MAG: (2Fe-2S)-binding protein [Marinifilaceae bacterium]|jgi:bacterioferritin-associated ferredoxin
MPDETLVCICMEIYKKEVADAIKAKKLKTIDDVAKAIGIGTACTECKQKINLILDEINN